MITLLPFIPYLAALFILFTPRSQEKIIKSIAIGATGFCLMLTIFLALTFDRSFNDFQFLHSWDCFSEMGIRYQVGLDGINLIFCLLHALVAFAAVFVAAKTKSRLKEYLFYYLILVGSMFAIFTVLNIFFLYVFYEMTLIPIFAMMGIAGGKGKENGAIKLTVYMTTGAVIALFAIFNLYKILGPDFLDLTKTTALLAANGTLLTPEIQKWLAALLIVGFGIMTSLWPFHSWSPATYSSAPESLSMIHAGVKIGPYFLIRIGITYLPLGFQFWAPSLAVLASVGIIYGGFAAIYQKNLKTMAAFSSVSHMGYIFLALASLNAVSLSAGIFLVFAHGLMTACLFALIGYLNDQAQTDEVHAFSGLGKSMPFFSVCLMMTCLASSGIPGFANFPAELLVFISSWKIFPFSVISGVIGVLLTAIYMIRAGHTLCFGPENAQQTKLKDMLTFYDKAPFLLLLAALIFFGIFPSGILSIIQPAIERLL